MHNFEPSYFFDLSGFKHKALFKGNFVWDALKEITGYLKAFSLGQIDGDVSPQAYLINPEKITIGKGSVVEPGAYIKGPCIIGENCVVRHGAYIRGNFIAGDKCVIGHDTEVKNAIFLNGAQAAHFAYIGDSILGNQCNLGAGTKLANLKLAHDTVFIHHEGKNIDTGLRKFGAVIGDKAQTGCNVVTNPGTLLGPLVRCYPCLNVGGFVPSSSIVKNGSATITVSLNL